MDKQLLNYMKNSDIQGMKSLLQLDSSLSNGKSLIMAIKYNNLDAVKLLIEYKADLNYRDEEMKSALDYSLYSFTKEIIFVLIESGAEIDIRDHFIRGIYTNNFRLVKITVERGADVNMIVNGSVPIIEASTKDNPEMLKFLIESGANVNVKDEKGDTPLRKACLYGLKNIARILIDNKAELNEQNNDLSTPLFAAIKRGNIEIIQMLIDAGVDINFTNERGRTALIESICWGKILCTELLLNLNACITDIKYFDRVIIKSICENDLRLLKFFHRYVTNLDIRDDKTTSLIYACEYASLEIVKYLVENGVDIYTKNIDDETCLNYSLYSNKNDITDYLFNQGLSFGLAKNNRYKEIKEQTHDHFQNYEGYREYRMINEEK